MADAVLTVEQARAIGEWVRDDVVDPARVEIACTAGDAVYVTQGDDREMIVADGSLRDDDNDAAEIADALDGLPARAWLTVTTADGRTLAGRKSSGWPSCLMVPAAQVESITAELDGDRWTVYGVRQEDA